MPLLGNAELPGALLPRSAWQLRFSPPVRVVTDLTFRPKAWCAMNAVLGNRPTPNSQLLRWLAEVMGVVLVAGWVAFVVVESIRTSFEPVGAVAWYQAAALLVVFAGYAVMWRHVLSGSLMVLAGIAAFFAVSLVTMGTAPGLQTLWFAVPGVLALLAQYLRRQEGIPAPK